jgi:hypothetical protein
MHTRPTAIALFRIRVVRHDDPRHQLTTDRQLAAIQQLLAGEREWGQR